MSTEKRARQLDVQAIIERLQTERCDMAHLQSQGPSRGVMQVISDLLAEGAESSDPVVKDKILTRVLRLPDRYRALCLEYLNAIGAYQSKDLRLLVAIQNTGGASIKVLTDTTIEPHISPGTGEELDTHDVVLEHAMLAPGEQIVLTAPRAVQLLHARCQDAWPPTARSYPHEDDDVEEVGYSYMVGGKPFEVGALKRRRGGKAA